MLRYSLVVCIEEISPFSPSQKVWTYLASERERGRNTHWDPTFQFIQGVQFSLTHCNFSDIKGRILKMKNYIVLKCSGTHQAQFLNIKSRTSFSKQLKPNIFFAFFFFAFLFSSFLLCSFPIKTKETEPRLPIIKHVLVTIITHSDLTPNICMMLGSVGLRIGKIISEKKKVV